MGSSILVSRAPFACLAWCFAFASSAVVWAWRSSGVGLPQSAPSLSSSFSRKRSKSRFFRSRPPSSSVTGPTLKFMEDRRGALHRFHLVRLLGLILGDGGGVEPGLNLEGLHRSRVEGSTFLALFLVAWQWGPLPRWGRQKRLVQLHGAVPDHRPDRGGDEVREAGLVRVLAGHRVGGQLADVHRGTELEVAGPVRVRAFGTCGPGRRPDRIALVIHRQLPMRARHLQGGRVGRRVNGLRLLAAPHALRGALPHPGHGAAGADPDVGSLPRGRFSRPPYPRPARLPTCCPGVLSRASCSYFILAM